MGRIIDGLAGVVEAMLAAMFLVRVFPHLGPAGAVYLVATAVFFACASRGAVLNAIVKGFVLVLGITVCLIILACAWVAERVAYRAYTLGKRIA